MSSFVNPDDLVITGICPFSGQHFALDRSTGYQFLIPLFTGNEASESANLVITSFCPGYRQFVALVRSTGYQFLIPLATENDDQPIIKRASESAIEALPMVKIKEKDLECAICLNEFDTGEEAKEMPCKHKFHSGCVEKWLRVNGSCPVCRYKMPEEEEVEKETESYSEEETEIYSEEETESDSETAQDDGEEKSVENQGELRIRFVNGQLTIEWATFN